jgi:hypothetical protein
MEFGLGLTHVVAAFAECAMLWGHELFAHGLYLHGLLCLVGGLQDGGQWRNVDGKFMLASRRLVGTHGTPCHDSMFPRFLTYGRSVESPLDSTRLKLPTQYLSFGGGTLEW